MKMRIKQVILGAAALLLFTSTATAQQVSYKLRNKVEPGQKPALVLVAGEPLDQVVLVLERDDGKVFKIKKRKLKVGQEVEFKFAQKAGKRHYKAELQMTLPGGKKSSASMEFDAVVSAGVEVHIDWTRSGLERKMLTFLADGPLAKAEMKVMGPKGLLESVDVPLGGIKAGEPLALGWTKDGEVVRISVKFLDEAGFWQGFESVRVDIPHDEVVFDSGKSTFGAQEAAKLDATYTLIVEELRKYDEFPISLYVSGYTDTVGADGGNVTLSFARARAIAGYFRRKGLRIQIYYQGFGERVLAVPTADNVDEAKNRRALYILSNAPPVSTQVPGSDWRVVR
jgi:outer membrane protein OmpA-like peptidoglycan-associated protein